MPSTSEQPGDPALAQPLPRGRHGIAPELIAADQRRRLLAAIATVTAARGFASVVVGDVTAAAGVSRATFYKLFEGKEQCLLAAHEAHTKALFAAIDRACDQHRDRQQKLAAALHAALAFLAADLAAAQLLTVTVAAVGPAGARRYHATLDALAARLPRGSAPGVAATRPGAAWGAIAFLSTIAGRAAVEADREAILALERDFVPILRELGGSDAASAAPS